MPEAVQLALTIALIVFILGWTIAVPMRRRARRSDDVVGAEPGPREVVVTLEVAADDAREPRVARLMEDAAARIFAAMPSVQMVQIMNTAGVSLGRRERAPATREVAIPDFLHEPHMKRRTSSIPDAPTTAGPSGSLSAAMGRTGYAVESFQRERGPIADRFDLPDRISSRLADRDDPVELVRAIMDAADLAPVVDDDVVLVGDRAIILLAEPGFAASSTAILNHAFIRFRASQARSAFAISFGFLDPIEVTRREIFEPALVHLGPDAVQRMADAVALGADPLRFARSPALEVNEITSEEKIGGTDAGGGER